MVTAQGFPKIRRTVAHDYEIRGVAQGACGLKQFSWNANTREVSNIYIGFMWFLVSFPLKLSQVGVTLGSIDERYI